jgi:hypothetical protein
VVGDRVPGGLRIEDVMLDGKAIVARQLTSLLASEFTAAEATGAEIEVDVIPGSPWMP